MLSLSPRFDLYRFMLPDDFMPEEVKRKYVKILLQEPGVLVDPVNYLNDSIKGITLPGISDINIQQQQHSTNTIQRESSRDGQLGRINLEPKQDNTYVGSWNPLDKINRELKVTFRLNQGLLNYYMIYETIFYRICKPELYGQGEDMFIDILSEEGVAYSRITLTQCNIDGIDGLDLSMDKIERQADTFDVTFKFNNIDYDFLNITDK